MIRMITRSHQVARRDVRIARSIFSVKGTLGLPTNYTYHRFSRIMLPIGEYTRFTATSMGYVRNDHRMACAELKDRLVTRRLKAQCTRYAWPGGYLLVSMTEQGNLLCPDCACTNDRDHPDDRIVETSTIDYVTDGWTIDDPEYTSAICDGCNVDMGTL